MTSSFLSHFLLTLGLLFSLFVIFGLTFIFDENQVFEFCDRLQIGETRKIVFEQAEGTWGTSRNPFAIGGGMEFLGSPFWVGVICVMEFENHKLTKAWKDID
jgi:protein-S-isoprenylcysteine O-methyltransferase Ste14